MSNNAGSGTLNPLANMTGQKITTGFTVDPATDLLVMVTSFSTNDAFYVAQENLNKFLGDTFTDLKSRNPDVTWNDFINMVYAQYSSGIPFNMSVYYEGIPDIDLSIPLPLPQGNVRMNTTTLLLIGAAAFYFLKK